MTAGAATSRFHGLHSSLHSFAARVSDGDALWVLDLFKHQS